MERDVLFVPRIDEVLLKTCPLFATGSSGRSEGLYLACLRETVLKVQNRSFFRWCKLQSEGFFVNEKPS